VIQDDDPYYFDGGGLSNIHRVHSDFLPDTIMGKLQNEEKGNEGELCVCDR